MVDNDARHEPPTRHASNVRSIFGSRLLWLAIVATLAGLAWWIWEAAQPGSAPTSTTTNAPSAASGLVASSGASGGAASTAAAEPIRAPLPFRAGVSFMGGFFIAWLCRKFLRWALLVGGAIAVLIAVLKGTGVLHLDWAAVESQVNSGLAVAEEQASATKDFLVRHLPSGAAAVVGMFAGARRT
ncbi:MAG: FUN14 domain-containing protein [Phycisphaerales bacterium]